MTDRELITQLTRDVENCGVFMFLHQDQIDQLREMCGFVDYEVHEFYRYVKGRRSYYDRKTIKPSVLRELLKVAVPRDERAVAMTVASELMRVA
jgi:ribosomal protein S27AE